MLFITCTRRTRTLRVLPLPLDGMLVYIISCLRKQHNGRGPDSAFASNVPRVSHVTTAPPYFFFNVHTYFNMAATFGINRGKSVEKSNNVYSIACLAIAKFLRTILGHVHKTISTKIPTKCFVFQSPPSFVRESGSVGSASRKRNC